MKTTLILLFIGYVDYVLSAEITPEQKEAFLKMQNECMAESGATQEMIMKAMAGDFPDIPEFKKQLVCAGKKSGIIDKDGNYHKEEMKKKLMMFFDDESQVNALLDKCDVHFDTLQETAFQMIKCLYKETVEES